MLLQSHQHRCPRCATCIRLHSVAPAGGSAGRPGTTLAATAVEVRLAGPAGKTVTKKLPLSTNVAALKLLCERLFQLKADRQVRALGARRGQVGLRGCASKWGSEQLG